MLDNDKQIDAFKALSGSGLVTPAPVVVCRETESLARTLATQFDEQLLSGATYPATVSGYTGKISGYATSCRAAAEASRAFSEAVTPYTTPAELIQLKTGWDCYVKGNRLSPAPAFALVSAMGDETIARGLSDLVKRISLSALTAAMTAINVKVSAAAGGAGTGAGDVVAPPTVPTFSDDEISALSAATTDLDAVFSLLPEKKSALTDYTNQVNTSTGTAKKALSDAVAIALTNSLHTDSVMGPAVAAIMPAAVLEALN